MSCDIPGGQNGIATSFSLIFISLPLLVIVPPLLHTHHHRLLQCDILLTREALCHIFSLWAGGFISAAALGWLQRAALLTGGTKVWKSENSRGLENRKCVSNYCYLRSNQFQPYRFDSNLHALYEPKRESRHLQSWTRIHCICVLWNLSHCTDVK
jgi:hypothetical protein